MKTLARSLALPALGVALGSLCFAEAADQTNAWYDEPWVALGAIAAFLSAASPLFAKAFESFSLSSKRKKALQHIEDLTGLMEKIKKQDVLSKSTLENVSAQIEAEIQTAVDGLDEYHENRQKKSEIREKANKKKQMEYSDLKLTRRLFLLYWPHGVGAWIAVVLAYLYAIVTLEQFYNYLSDSDSFDSDLLTGALIISAIAWISAWWGRRRWETANLRSLAVGSGTEVRSGGTQASGS